MRSFAVVAALVVMSCKGSSTGPETGRPAAGAKPPASTIPGVELAELAGAGSVPWEAGPPLLAVAPTTIVLDGRQVVPMRDGAVDPAEKEGGALGLKIAKLTAALAAVAAGPDGSLDIAIDRRLSFRLLVELLFSAKQKEAGRTRFNILARAGGALVAIPIALPNKAPPSAVGGGSRSLAGQLTALIDEESSLDADTVLAKIQSSYMKGIKRCYKDLLRSDPTAGGALKLSLDVTAKGRLDHPSAVGVDPSVETCVEKAMAGWKFPIPLDGDGDATEASFQVTLRLVPDDDSAPPPPEPAPAPAPALPVAEVARVVKPAPEPPGTPPPDEMPIKLVVSVTSTELILWSISGDEGTLKDPKVTIARSKATAVAELGQALAEIVQRRWGGRARPETSHEIIVMADSATTMQAVTEIFAAVRATPDGKPLFRDILLSPGLE